MNNASAQKWGGVQKKVIANIMIDSIEIPPVETAHPIIGGNAPAAPPITMFCGVERVLQPGERVEMPVTFYVDPEIVDDPEAKYAKHITLSYTFHEMDLADTDYQAALETEKTTEIN